MRAFISSWISRFGVPATLTSDRGAQSTSSVWAGVCRILGISTSQTTSFHPQSNGMIERFHRSLKSSLRARAADSDWVLHLPLVLLGLRSVPKEDTGFSVSEAVYGSPLTVPVEVPVALRTAKFVFVREDASKPSLSPLYRGPYLVIERRSKFFRLQVGDKIDSVSVDRLKPVFSESPVIPAAPPPRGRPPLRQPKDPPVHSSAAKSSASKRKSVSFLNQPTVMPRRNPHRQVRKEGYAPP